MSSDVYTTKNLSLATYLYTSGLNLVGTNRSGNEVFFQFSSKAKAEKLLSDYFSGRATVDPRELFARFNDLKDLIFSGSGR